MLERLDGKHARKEEAEFWLRDHQAPNWFISILRRFESLIAFQGESDHGINISIEGVPFEVKIQRTLQNDLRRRADKPLRQRPWLHDWYASMLVQSGSPQWHISHILDDC